MKVVIGLDGGGTKTEGICLNQEGEILNYIRGGPSNFQVTGTMLAQETIKGIIDRLINGFNAPEVTAICYGLAGVDRDRDVEIITEFIEPIHLGGKYEFVNDSMNALRSGTKDNVGIALISGTGNNAMGRNQKGEIWRVGGLGYDFGDYGSGSDIGQAGLRAASRYIQERGPKTILKDLICETYNLDHLYDLMEFWYEDNYPAETEIKDLCPLVFKAARLGDYVAAFILKDVGYEFAQNAKIIAKHLFPDEKGFTLVLGGSVFQKGECPILVNTILDSVRRDYPAVELKILQAPPVLGAGLRALDLAGFPGHYANEEMIKQLSNMADKNNQNTH